MKIFEMLIDRFIYILVSFVESISDGTKAVWAFIIRHRKVVFIAQLLLLTVIFGLILMELVGR